MCKMWCLSPLFAFCDHIVDNTLKTINNHNCDFCSNTTNKNYKKQKKKIKKPKRTVAKRQ